MTQTPGQGAQRPASVEKKISADSVLGAPRRPVTRWNRTYILLGAAVLAALIGAGFLIGFGPPAKPTPKDRAADPGAQIALSGPDFGDRFSKGYADPSLQTLRAAGPDPTGSTAGPPGPAVLSDRNDRLSPDPASAASGAAASARAEPSPEVQQARSQSVAARSSGPFFNGASASTPSRAADPTVQSQGIVAPALGQDAVASFTEVQPANGQGAKRQFLAEARSNDYLTAPLRAPLSPWEVKAGSIISAALITAINSDLPGEVIAQVTRPVYDHVTGRTVLIPQGARLIGVYDSQIAYGQQRALVAWTRLIMPDGRSINLGSMAGADLSGAAGLQDQIDGHFGRLAQGVLLSAIFSAGVASAQDASNRSSGQLVINSAASGVANSAQQVGQQITERDLNRQPTLKIRAGSPLTVLVNKDMVLAPYP